MAEFRHLTKVGSIPSSQMSILRKDFGSMDEMFEYAYGGAYTLRKDSEVDMDTTGARNAIFGAKLNREVVVAFNTFGALPKVPWDKSGYRIISAAGSTSTAGLAENAAPPATLQPTVVEVDVKPQLLANGWEMSAQMWALQGKDDNATWAEYVAYEGDEFKNRLNRDLHADANTTISAGLESLNRIVASNAEVALCDAGDLDPYGYGSAGTIDRDGGTTYDSYVSHNSDTDRVLALSQIDSLFTNCRPYWNNYAGVDNKVIITGFDTLERLEQLIQSQQRFMPDMRVQFGVNGVQSLKGAEGGMDIASYKGVPIVPDNNTLTDSTLSTVYLIDMDRCYMGILSPVQYFETPDFTGHDKFTHQGYFWMMGQTVANGFHCHGKVRDLK